MLVLAVVGWWCLLLVDGVVGVVGVVGEVRFFCWLTRAEKEMGVVCVCEMHTTHWTYFFSRTSICGHACV